jgi:hypothetical protein
MQSFQSFYIDTTSGGIIAMHYLHQLKDILCIIMIAAISVYQYRRIIKNINLNNSDSNQRTLYHMPAIILGIILISNPFIQKVMLVLYGLALCFLFTYSYLYQLKYGIHHDIKRIQSNISFMCILYIIFGVIILLLRK